MTYVADRIYLLDRAVIKRQLIESALGQKNGTALFEWRKIPSMCNEETDENSDTANNAKTCHDKNEKVIYDLLHGRRLTEAAINVPSVDCASNALWTKSSEKVGKETRSVLLLHINLQHAFTILRILIL